MAKSEKVQPEPNTTNTKFISTFNYFFERI